MTYLVVHPDSGSWTVLRDPRNGGFDEMRDRIASLYPSSNTFFDASAEYLTRVLTYGDLYERQDGVTPRVAAEEVGLRCEFVTGVTVERWDENAGDWEVLESRDITTETFGHKDLASALHDAGTYRSSFQNDEGVVFSSHGFQHNPLSGPLDHAANAIAPGVTDQAAWGATREMLTRCEQSTGIDARQMLGELAAAGPLDEGREATQLGHRLRREHPEISPRGMQRAQLVAQRDHSEQAPMLSPGRGISPSR